MALTISSALIAESTSGFRNLAFQNIGSAASKVVSANGSVSAASDHIALNAGSRLGAQSAGHKQGVANAAKATSMLQVAGDALDEIDVKLDRMKQLAADASLTALSVTNPAPNIVSAVDRAIMNIEFATLRAEIDTIATNTSFGNTKLLDGLNVTFTLGGGAQSGDSIAITLASAKAVDLAAGLATAGISTLGGATAALAHVTTAIGALDDIQTAVRGAEERFGFASGNLAFGASVADAERTGRLTPDVTLDISLLAANQLLDQRGIDASSEGAALDRALLTRVIGSLTTGIDAMKTEPDDSAKSAPSAPAPAAVSSEPKGQSVSLTV